MRKKKWIVNLFSMFALFLMAFSFSEPLVSAKYEPKNDGYVKNSLAFDIDPATDLVKFQLNYQIQVKDVFLYICDNGRNTAEMCKANNTSFFANNTNMGGNSPKYEKSSINTTDKLATYDFVSNINKSKLQSGKKISEYEASNVDKNGKPINTYDIVIEATYCKMTDLKMTKCEIWGDSKAELLKDINISSGITGNVKVNKTVNKVLTIVNGYVIPILWAALGALLIIRGIILGMDIVKSSDDPEIRNKKIKGLVWLFIGVLVAYLVTILASLYIKTLI